MPRHLRPVPTTSPPEGPTYLVGRSEYTRPGTPYVVAQCVDHRMAGMLALGDQEVYQAEDMRKDPALARALEAWEAGDHQVHESDHAARSAFSRSERVRLFRQVPGQHPSVLSKIQGV